MYWPTFVRWTRTLKLEDREQAQQKRRNRKRARRLAQFQSLENRAMFAGDLRSFDGTGNNLLNPEWGSTDEDLLRTTPAAYADGISAPAGADRPSAREVSNNLSAHPDDPILNDRGMSAMVYAFGQFVDHDIDLTTTGTTESMPIAVPTGDPFFDPLATGTQTIDFTRSAYDPATGLAISDPRQQQNTITAFIDGSQIYGSNATLAAQLRTGSGGRLKTSDGNLLPLNTDGIDPNSPSTFFVAGDVRANENIDLIAMQTLWVREHNRIAANTQIMHPDWTDEQIYQEARKVVIGELQAITYNEFLPALLGQNALKPYQGYNPNVNPDIANEFSTAAFRLGHSMLGDDIEFLDNNGNEIHDAVELRDAFFNPDLVKETGIDGILKYLASDTAEEIDTKLVDDVRNFLFGPPGAGGFDLASLNIQRGRDHGLADYNSARVAYGLAPVTRFDQITSDPEVQQALQTTYGDVNHIDLWVGGLAEDHVKGASVGALFSRIIADQFERLRDGDRFWYENVFSGRQLDKIEHTTLADVIRRNSLTTNLQDNVFFFHTAVAGRVVNDANADGILQRKEVGMPGVQVQLLDNSGEVVATTTTNRMGRYAFHDIELGTYQVRLALLPEQIQTTTNPADITVTKGGTVSGVKFGVQLLPPVAPAPKPAPQQNPPPNQGPAPAPAPKPAPQPAPKPAQAPLGGVNPAAVDLLMDPQSQKKPKP